MARWEEWAVYRNDKLWSDRFNNEDECIEHIEECVQENGDTKDDYSYRKMTQKEIEAYYK